MTPKGDLSVVSPLEGHASVFLRQQALVAAISEKDANIALLELSSNKRKKAQEEVMALKREKDRLMHQLKQQPFDVLLHMWRTVSLTILTINTPNTLNTPNTPNTPNTTLTSTIHITPTRCISTTGVSPGAHPMPTTGPPWTSYSKLFLAGIKHTIFMNNKQKYDSVDRARGLLVLLLLGRDGYGAPGRARQHHCQTPGTSPL
ncbi:unnamed protein product [Arctogadus glacialis]